MTTHCSATQYTSVYVIITITTLLIANTCLFLLTRQHDRHVQWRRGRGKGAKESNYPFPKLRAGGKWSKLKIPIFGRFGSKNEILSADNFLCRKFAVFCRNSVGSVQCLLENCNFLPGVLFLTQNAAGRVTKKR